VKQLTLILLLVPVITFAQINDPAGARPAGMANSALTFTDIWSIYHNQAGIAHLEHLQAGAFYENRFLVNELAYAGFAVASPLGGGSIGLSYGGFGYSVYRESKVGLAYAMKLGDRLSAGVQLNYQHVRINADNYGARGVLTAELGVQMQLSERVTAAAHVFNPTNTQLTEFDGERLPAALRIGLGYQISEEVLAAAEAEKDIDNQALFRAGIEYHPVDIFYLRLGASSSPNLFSFGLGFKFDQFSFDLAASYHSFLGYSPQASLTYHPSKK
jgi:hypothetical protein